MTLRELVDAVEGLGGDMDTEVCMSDGRDVTDVSMGEVNIAFLGDNEDVTEQDELTFVNTNKTGRC